MTIRFLSIAQREFVEAVEWYQSRNERIAVDFVSEYDRAIHEILHRPQQFARAETTRYSASLDAAVSVCGVLRVDGR